jgi:hypothetical protein
MNERDDMNLTATALGQRQRELLLCRYQDALEMGDFAEMEAVLAQAEQDPELSDALWELQATLAEAPDEAFERDAQTVRTLAASHLTSPVVATAAEAAALAEAMRKAAETEPELPPITVAEVAARLRGQRGVGKGNDPQARPLIERLSRISEPIGEDVSVRGIRGLLTRLGVADAGRRVVDAFHEAAFFLTMGRQQENDLRLAATRKATARRETARQTERTRPEEQEDREAAE